MVGASLPMGGLVNSPPLAQRGDCITPRERLRVAEMLGWYEAQFGPLSQQGAAAAAVRYPFWPQAGYVYGDLFSGIFVDLDPTGGIRDYHCTDFTYDTHAGTDCGLRSFAEQAIGVPVFSALDGTVVATDDGHDDMHVNGDDNLANFVIVDHGNGRLGYYWHLKKNSVIVSVNDHVRAGQQVGLTASSGYSYGPHLHFESRDLPGYVVYEPFAGDCRTGDSGWVHQEPLRLDTYLIDFAFTYEDLFNHQPFPYEQPRSGQIAFSDTFIYYWFQYANLPANSTWRNVFIKPDGSTYYDSGDQPWNNGSFYRYNSGFFYWYMADMHTVAGTWRVRMYFNDQLMTDAPIEVVPTRDPNFNRAPEPISVHFDPVAPSPSDAIFCRVDTDLVLDDLDYDIVRYEYVWTVDGVEVRRVTSAGQADALAAEVAGLGSLVECVVTPSDGKTSGSSASASVVVGSVCTGDEKLKASCRAKGNAFLLKAGVSAAQAGATVTFRLDDDSQTDVVKTVSDRGKAKTKFKGVPGGDHVVSLIECGLSKSLSCP